MRVEDTGESRVALRQLVGDQLEREQLRRETEAQERVRIADEARALAERERNVKQLAAVFVDAMRRAGNPGVEERCISVSRQTRRHSIEVDGSPVRGWVLYPFRPDFKDSTPGALLGTDGQLYVINHSGRLSPTGSWQPVGGEHVAAVMARCGVSP